MFALINDNYTVISDPYESFGAAVMAAEDKAKSRASSVGIIRIDIDGRPIPGNEPVWLDDCVE